MKLNNLQIGYKDSEEEQNTEPEVNVVDQNLSSSMLQGSAHSATVTPTGTSPPATMIIREGVSQKSNKRVPVLIKPTRPSLSKIVLSLESLPSQQQALQQILNALQIINSREAIVAALSSPHTAIAKGGEFQSIII